MQVGAGGAGSAEAAAGESRSGHEAQEIRGGTIAA